jgi:hypothetical protein
MVKITVKGGKKSKAVGTLRNLRRILLLGCKLKTLDIGDIKLRG